MFHAELLKAACECVARQLDHGRAGGVGAELVLTHAVVVGTNWETCCSLALLNLYPNTNLPAQWGTETHQMGMGCWDLPWGALQGASIVPLSSHPQQRQHTGRFQGRRPGFECVLHLALRFAALFLLVTSAQLFLCITAPDEVFLLV